MPLTVHYHPFASFCQKVLIALYEADVPFMPHLVDLGDAESRAQFHDLWPIGKMPVLRDAARDRTIPESTIIIEYLALYYPGRARLVPRDPDAALNVRLQDRFFDLHVAEPMQKIVVDRIRPSGHRDPFGVTAARTALQTAYRLLERNLGGQRWAADETFTMADCAAATALFYADWVEPLGTAYPRLADYFARLTARASVARVIEEAKPFRHLFPQEPERG